MGPIGTSPLAGAKSYTFEKVADGAKYGITVLNQPTGLKCRFQGTSSDSTSGVMGSAATNAATLDCTPQ